MNFLDKVKAWFRSVWQKIKDGWFWLADKVKGIFKKKDKDPSEEKPRKEKPVKEKKPRKVKNGEEKGMFGIICLWIFKLRSVFMAIPVVFTAILFAVENMSLLPAKIVLYVPQSQQELLTSKLVEFSRDTAVYFPLAVTGVCLTLMFCSRRTVYPWLISIFSLVLPLFFRFISTFPG